MRAMNMKKAISKTQLLLATVVALTLLLTPAAFAARTSGRKQSKLIDLPRDGSSSKDGSFEIQARWITASHPANAFSTATE